METEGQLCARYQKQMAAIAALDRRYYLNPCPTIAERRNYATRQAQLEAIRSLLYADLAALRACGGRLVVRCRSLV